MKGAVRGGSREVRFREGGIAGSDTGAGSGEHAADPSRHCPRLLLAVTHPMTADLLLRGQLATLVGRGFRVALLSSPGPQLGEVARREGVDVLPVPLRRRPAPVADLVAVLRTARILRRFRPHLVNAGTPKAGLVVGLAARLVGVPRRLYTVRGLPLETVTGLRRLPLAAAERTASAAAQRVVCVSESLRRRYVELGLAPEGKTAVLGHGASNGVDTERFHPATLPASARPAREEGDGVTGNGAGGSAEPTAVADREPPLATLRREVGLPPDAPVVGFVGRFTRDKGIADLAAAFFDHLLPRFPETRLLLLGDFEAGDPVDPATRRRLEQDPRVVRPGFVPDPAPWYRRMDVLAFPSYREGFPNAPLEAAASAVPVAGYAATGTVDAVADGETGTLVPVGDADALAAALVRYLEDPGLRRRHGRAGRERAVALFHNEKVWQDWTDLYVAELESVGLPVPRAGRPTPGARHHR